MKIILIGASGKIGRAAECALSDKHEIIRVGSRGGDIQCDYTDPASVQRLFVEAGAFDALICAAGGDSVFKGYEQLIDDDYRYGFERKFLSQVRLLQLGYPHINDNGSFTFTSGFLSHYPNPASIATGPLNAAIDTFVMNTAPLLERGVRVNIVSPAPVVESFQKALGLVTAEETAAYYTKSVEGRMTGEVLRAWGGLPESEDD